MKPKTNKETIILIIAFAFIVAAYVVVNLTAYIMQQYFNEQIKR